MLRSIVAFCGGDHGEKKVHWLFMVLLLFLDAPLVLNLSNVTIKKKKTDCKFTAASVNEMYLVEIKLRHREIMPRM